MNFEDIASQNRVVFETAWLKTQFLGVHVSPGSVEILVRRGGKTHDYSIVYFLSNIPAKNY